MHFSDLENLFQLECVWLEKFIFKKKISWNNIKRFLSFLNLIIRYFNFI